jgi:hypothetical protein
MMDEINVALARGLQVRLHGCSFAAVHESGVGPERSPWLAAFESGVGGIAVTATGDRRGRV